MSKRAVLATPPFATDDDQAASRYEDWAVEDPFPSIPPALLNSADIRDYVAATGMVWPFRDDDNLLKPASYEVPLLGRYIYWDERDQRLDGIISKGEPFTLPPNSIAFVTLEPMIRLPAYIAIRFNLKITHIYRGLLLGTGPLVDPGFTGRLSIPLHNLTTNSYTFRGGDGLIWMEFTKLSSDPTRTKATHDAFIRRGRITPLPENKKGDLDVEDYLAKADPHRSKRSSIPEAVREAQVSAESAKAEIQSLKKLGIPAIALTIVGLLIGAVWTLYAVISDTNSRIDELRPTPAPTAEVQQLRARISQLERQVKQLQEEPSEE